MPAIAPHASIAELPTDRSDLLGYEIRAKIEKEDIEWMARRVEAAFAREDLIDLVLVMRNYEGAELSAIFDTEMMKSQADSAKHVRRYGVVGAPLWAKAMINLFKPISPVEAKTFDLEEEAEAWRWVNSASA